MKIGVKKRLALELASVRRDAIVKEHPLRYLFWECTLRCNISCLHCGSDCNSQSGIPDMPVKDFLAAIDTITPHVDTHSTMIVITGGEPLMRPDLEAVGVELYKREYPWGIVTNGYGLTSARLAGLVNAGLRSITVSLDGFEREHNMLRGNSKSFQRAVNAIAEIARYDGLVWDVVTCVSKLNLTDLPKIKSFLIDLGVKNWRVFNIFPSGRAKGNPLFQLSPQEFKSVFDFIAQTRKEGLIKVSYGCEGFLGGYEMEVRSSFYFCRAGVTVGSILIDGSIAACPSIRSSFVQGNIYKDNFMEVWDNKYQDFRDRSWTKKGNCKSCSCYRYCLGNSIHLYDDNRELAFCHMGRINATLSNH